MSLGSKLLHQCRKPTGWLGRFILRDMNRRHSALTDWGLKHISIENHDTILDVGCGGGRTVHKLAAIAREGKIYGIDFSEESVAASTITNKQWIEDMREVLRVLQPGGVLIIIAEAYKGGKYDKLLQRLVEVAKTMNYAHLSVNEHTELFTKAGYCDVQVFEEYDKGWISGVGRKPS